MLSISLRTAPAVLLLPVMLALAACSQAQTPPGKAATASATTAPASAAKGDRPAVLKGIEKHGFEVVAEFDAPDGLRGFAGVVGGQQPAAAYVTADGASNSATTSKDRKSVV